MERVHRVITAIAGLGECTPASVGQSPKWSLMAQNMADTRRNLHQLLRGKQLYRTLYGVHTEVLQDLAAVIKESAAEGEIPKTTFTAPPSVEEFREQRRRMRKPTDNADKRAQKSTTSTMTVNNPQLQSKPKGPTRNFFAALRSIEVMADHGDDAVDADDTTKIQQHQAPSSQAGMPPPIVLTSHVNVIQLQWQLRVPYYQKRDQSCHERND
jgi:hypothetical protein